jgi:putative flippase GtrA
VRSAAAEVPRQFANFLVVGSIGFVADGGLLLALIHVAGLSPPFARLISFSVAVTVTWLLNRLLTFRRHASDRRLAEWRRYVVVNGIGGLINLGIFMSLVGPVPGFGVEPLIAFAIASAVALLFNFLGSRCFAFRGASPSEDRQAPPPF